MFKGSNKLDCKIKIVNFDTKLIILTFDPTFCIFNRLNLKKSICFQHSIPERNVLL